MHHIVRWFANNSTAANLLMFFLIGAGLFSLFNMKQELFPEIKPNIVSIRAVYPGATTAQVEEAVCVKIEEAIDGIEGIKRITSSSNEGLGIVTVEMFYDSDWDKIVDDVKAAVDGIVTFPSDVETPVVRQVSMTSPVLQVAISADMDPIALRRISEEIQDEVAALKNVTSTRLVQDKAFELSVEVSEQTLRSLDLTFDDVANAIRRTSINVSAGTVKTDAGEILLRSEDQAMTVEAVENIPLLTRPDGTRLYIRDIATVHDQFDENDTGIIFNDKPSLMLRVYRVGEQSVPDVAGDVHRYVENKQQELDAAYAGAVKLTIWDDWSIQLEGRKDLLLKNGITGFVLIFVVLALFLKLTLAFWVTIGVATACVGTFWLMPYNDASINMMSLFAFIVVLGIMVDDAIVVSENVYFHRFTLRKPGFKAALEGTLEVLTPVIIAVLTTIAAFLPMATMSGTSGQFARVVPQVVVLALILSLVESLLILPAHLAHLKEPKPHKSRWHPSNLWGGFQHRFDRLVQWFIDKSYRPTLNFSIRFRYFVIVACLATIPPVVSLMAAGKVGFVFFPEIEGDNIVAMLTMPAGTPAEKTEAWIEQVETIGRQVVQDASNEFGSSLFVNSMVTVGSHPVFDTMNWERGGGGATVGHKAEVNIQLIPAETREGEQYTAHHLLDEWRRRVGVIPEAVEMRYTADISGAARAIGVQLMSGDPEVLRAARDELRDHLSGTTGVMDLSDDLRDGKREYRITMLPEGYALGLTQAEIARQVRQAFYGEEAQRLQRGRDDVKVFVRYPEGERRSLGNVEDMRIRTPMGDEVPFRTVARAELETSLAAINRARRERAVEVTANVNNDLANGDVINKELRETFLPALAARHHGLRWSMEGAQADQAETMESMARGNMIAMLMIFSLLALAFRNFLHPLVVMMAIPFGLCGAILGHWFFGLAVQPTPFTILSIVGVLAMSGVVVNDSMILVDFINRTRADGVALKDAVIEAGPRRFRAILITSLTTFAGLFPMLLERSVQAQFLIPMAISLAFGVMYSTFFILVFVPALYMALEDVKKLLKRSWNWAMSRPQPVEPAWGTRRGLRPASQTGSNFAAARQRSSAPTSVFEMVLDVSEGEQASESARRRRVSGRHSATKADTPPALGPAKGAEERWTGPHSD